MAVTANLLLIRFRGILLEEEPSMLVMKNEQILAKQKAKLKGKNQPVQRPKGKNEDGIYRKLKKNLS